MFPACSSRKVKPLANSLFERSLSTFFKFRRAYKAGSPTVSEAVCKESLDPPKEGLDRIRTVFAQRPCQAISNHFTHSLLEAV